MTKASSKRPVIWITYPVTIGARMPKMLPPRISSPVARPASPRDRSRSLSSAIFSPTVVATPAQRDGDQQHDDGDVGHETASAAARRTPASPAPPWSAGCPRGRCPGSATESLSLPSNIVSTTAPRVREGGQRARFSAWRCRGRPVGNSATRSGTDTGCKRRSPGVIIIPIIEAGQQQIAQPHAGGGPRLRIGQVAAFPQNQAAFLSAEPGRPFRLAEPDQPGREPAEPDGAAGVEGRAATLLPPPSQASTRLPIAGPK